jgi:hypothetical protein
VGAGAAGLGRSSRPPPSVRDRGGRLNEFVPLLRHLWTRPEEPWDGKHFQVPAIGLVRPLTPGGPPIFLGAGAPAGVRRAARYGDGFISVGLPPETVARISGQLAGPAPTSDAVATFPSTLKSPRRPQWMMLAPGPALRGGGCKRPHSLGRATISGISFLAREDVARALSNVRTRRARAKYPRALRQEASRQAEKSDSQ